MHRVVNKIITLLPGMTRAENKIAYELIENPEAIERRTLAEIARDTGSSEATFVRFCRQSGSPQRDVSH